MPLVLLLVILALLLVDDVEGRYDARLSRHLRPNAKLCLLGYIWCGALVGAEMQAAEALSFRQERCELENCGSSEACVLQAQAD